MKPLIALAAASVLSVASVGHAQDPELNEEPASTDSSEYVLDEAPPTSGLGFIISGSVLTGLGVLNMAATPICLVDEIVPDSAETPCVAASLIVGGTMFLVGLPLLIVGVSKRSTYKEWREQHPGYAALSGLGFSVGQHGTGAVWQTEF